MARWIDQFVLWGFAALSAYIFAMTLTEKSIVLSALFAFLIVFTLRLLIIRIPDKRWISPQRKRQYAASLLRKWALVTENEALAEIKNLLGEAFRQDEKTPLHLFQSFPDFSATLTANHLIKIWKQHSGEKCLMLLSTVPADGQTFSLCEELNSPSVQLIDGEQLLHLLVRSIRTLPEIPAKSRRPGSIRIRIARFIQAVHPLRTGVYISSFLMIYLLTDSVLYLSAALAEALLLGAHFIAKRKSVKHPFP